jgi:hypothetical protein
MAGSIPATAAASRRPLPLAAALAVLGGLTAATLAGAMLFALGARPIGDVSNLGVSPDAVADIPPGFLRLYEAAAQRYGLDWSILAAIGKVECDHGRDPDPSCTREGATNSAGAGGPAQFLAATWAQYGVDADGNGVRDRWAPADAVFGMANLVRASGAPADYPRAIFAYNHASWYVAEVLKWAARYRSAAASAGASPGTAQVVPGARATLSPGNGHVALVPLGAPPAVQAMIAAGNRLQDLPYGPAGHPDPRGAASQDCSSSVSYVLMAAGARTAADVVSSNPLAQDYVTWGLPGPGRWVTIYATTTPTEHVFVVIAGLRLDTSHRGTDVGPNRDQDGPRWRILDHLPGWAAWAVRHPPGL